MGGVTIEGSDDEKSIVTPDLRLRFSWAGDRWTHSLDLRIGAGWRVVASTMEADVGRDGMHRLVSPTYQDLVLRAGPDEGTALLVGQHGPHHFSAAIRVSRETGREDGPWTVLADVADRCPSGVDLLSATYAVFAPIGSLVETNAYGATCRLDGESGGGILAVSIVDRLKTADQFAIAGADADRFCMQFRSTKMSRPGTLRLFYSMAASPGDLVVAPPAG